MSKTNYSETPTTVVTHGMSQNRDKSGNYSLGVTHGQPGNSANGNVFVNSLTKDGTHGGIGGNVGFEKSGVGGQVGAVHSSRGNQLSASGKMNVIDTSRHELSVNASANKTMPKNHPSFVTHGRGVDYKYKIPGPQNNTIGAGASVAHTPMFKHTQQNIGAHMNMNPSPNTSMGLNIGASKTTTPYSSGNWQHSAFFNVQKRF